MLRVTCSACGQTYIGRSAEEVSPQDCELCGAIGTVTPIRAEEESPSSVSGRPVVTTGGSPAKTVRGPSGAAMPFGAALLFLGVLIWVLSGENQGSPTGKTVRMRAAHTSRLKTPTPLEKKTETPDIGGIPDADTTVQESAVRKSTARKSAARKQKGTSASQMVGAKPAGTQPASTSPASQPSPPPEPTVFLVPKTIPNHWRDMVAKAKGSIPPFDDLGRPGTPTTTPAGFFRMVQDYVDLPENEQLVYLQWIATTHESDDLRIWACSMLGDMGHKDELRGVQQHQDSERTQKFIENFLTRKPAKRTVVKTKDRKK